MRQVPSMRGSSASMSRARAAPGLPLPSRPRAHAVGADHRVSEPLKKASRVTQARRMGSPTVKVMPHLVVVHGGGIDVDQGDASAVDLADADRPVADHDLVARLGHAAEGVEHDAAHGVGLGVVLEAEAGGFLEVVEIQAGADRVAGTSRDDVVEGGLVGVLVVDLAHELDDQGRRGSRGR